jgi:hypothetical protein
MFAPSNAAPLDAASFAAVPSRAAAGERLCGAGIVMLLTAVTFGQRFCFPLGTFQIPIAAPVAFLSLWLFFVSGRVRISTVGLLLYSLTVSCLILTLYFGKIWFSPFSLFYLILLYLVYVFSIDVSRADYLRYVKFFQNAMLVMAVIAFAQFAEQITTHTRLTLFDYIPTEFWIRGYNTRPTLGYESTFYKANAEFFLEPSFLSQYLAIAIINELLFFGRWRRMALYAGAIFCSFSGTGMVLLALFAIVSVVKAKRYELLYPLPLLLILFLVFQDNTYVQAITGRITEINDQASSAYIRFGAPNEALADVLFGHFGTFLVGKGPGAVDQISSAIGVIANYPVFHKLMIEYGLVGTLPFLSFILYCALARPRSRILAAALLVMYLVLSGSLLQPHTIYLFYVLAIAMPSRPEEAEAAAPQRGAPPGAVPYRA